MRLLLRCHRRLRRLPLLLLILLFAAPASGGPSRAERVRMPLGTAQQRGALFDEVVAKTLAREQFSPPKNERLALDFARDARSLRDDFVQAKTEQDLYYALVRLSNLRKDTHLGVEAIPSGVVGDRPEGLIAPIDLDVHHGKPRFLFVSDVGERFVRSLPATHQPRFGDRVVGINGVDFETFRRRAEPYVRYSTEASFWVELAIDLTVSLPADYPPELQGETLRLELERSSGERYRIEVPFVDARKIVWRGWGRNQSYPGYRSVLETRSFVVHRPETERPVLLIRVRGFHPRLLRSDLVELMEYATRNDLLRHHVICDLTRSFGGNLSWLLVQHLSARPFRAVASDIRISDVTPALIERAPRTVSMNPLASPMRVYTAAVPEALRAHHDAPDGILPPAPVHFTGQLVGFFGPEAGSSVDQFAAMFIDNDLGLSIGMPSAGYSNSWEWRETLVLPGTGLPVLDFTWSIGRTIRPNGEVLEGNPPTPRELLTFTRENYRERYSLLLERAHRQLFGSGAP